MIIPGYQEGPRHSVPMWTIQIFAPRSHGATKPQPKTRPLHHGAPSPGKAGIQRNGQLNVENIVVESVKTKPHRRGRKGRKGTQVKLNLGVGFSTGNRRREGCKISDT